MKGVSHAIIGVAVVGVIHLRLAPLGASLLDLAPVAVLAAAGALLPDVDSDEATIRQATGTARHSGCLGRLLSAGVQLLGGHRGALTHSLLAWLIVAAVSGVYFHGNMHWVAFAAGYLSHLLADALTVEGVPLLWPVVRRRICFLPRLVAVRTGGAAEAMALVALGAAVAVAYITR